MSTTIRLGKGTSVQTNLSGTNTEIPNVESVTIGEINTEVEEIEQLNQTENYPLKIPVKVTYGDITVVVQYDPTTHAILDAAAETLKSPGVTFTITVGDFGTWDCVGVSAADIAIEKSKVLKRQYRFIVQNKHST